VAWYKNESATLKSMNNNKVIPGSSFFHIPLFEHLDLWNTKPMRGNLGEEGGVCCSSVNTGLYGAFREMGDIKYSFCGHDHNNDYYGDYFGITLGYGRKTGYGSYGPPSGWMHGARVIEFTQNSFEIKTWLRVEDGSIEDQPTQTPGSSYRFVGCCDMDGHGKETDSSVLYMYLFNSLWFILVIFSLWGGRLMYKRCKRRVVDGGSYELAPL